MKHKIRIAISPCPNDTFMFWAMLHRQVDTFGMTFSVEMRDIEQLNRAGEEQEFDMLKISYAHYPKISQAYQLLTAGSALGFGTGPLLVSRRKIYPEEVPYLRIAIPGVDTTANMLLTIACPAAKKKTVYLFSDIEEAVLSDEADAGLLIHETRFTYAQKGLRKIVDLGEYWEKETGLPLPLGAIAVRCDLPEETKQKLNTALRESVRFALQNPKATDEFVIRHAQAMSLDVCRKHIALYVNEFSVYLGEIGTQAVHTLFDRGRAAGLFSNEFNIF
jgi:1,4-dihydroxy-6-naphthoate synthase